MQCKYIYLNCNEVIKIFNSVNLYAVIYQIIPLLLDIHVASDFFLLETILE